MPDDPSPSPPLARRTVWTFATASFLHDLGADMVFSVWPIFLTTVLGASKAAVGLVDGLGDAVVALSQAGAGYASDRIRRRKPFIWVGYLLGGIARLGYAAAPAWQAAIPFRILDRSGKMRGSPRDAIVSDVSDHRNRGRNFGVLRTMDNLGAVTGIVLAYFLLPLLGFRTLFLLAAIPSALAAIVVLVLSRERRPEGRIFRGIRLRDLSRDLKLFLVLSALFELGAFSYSFLLLGASELGFAATSVPIFYLLFTVIAAAFSYPCGALSDAIGRKTVLGLAFAAWAATCVVFLALPSPAALIGAFVLYGASRAAIDTVQKAFVAELAPKEYVASTLGGFQMVVGLCSLPSSLAAGLLWDSYGMSAPFGAALALTAAASALLLFVREKP